jgi:hypothetical protein
MAATPDQAYRPILEAMATLQSSADRAQKTQAHDFLDKFQKSVGGTSLLCESRPSFECLACHPERGNKED